MFQNNECNKFMFIFNYALQPLRLTVRTGLEVPTFATRRLHSCHHARVPSGATRNVREFCLNTDFHVTFRDLLHAAKLRHGTDGFTSPPEEGVLRIFFRPKNPTASVGCEPANLVSPVHNGETKRIGTECRNSVIVSYSINITMFDRVSKPGLSGHQIAKHKPIFSS